MNILYFAHAGADHSHGVTSHGHVETPAGETTVLWVVLISIAAGAALFLAARWLSRPSRQVRPQEQEQEDN